MKALKESGKFFSRFHQKQSVSKLMTSTVTQSTDRYSGGAKERARENLEEGTATRLCLVRRKLSQAANLEP